MRSILCVFLTFISVVTFAVELETIDKSFQANVDQYMNHKLHSYMTAEDHEVLAYILSPIHSECQTKQSFVAKSCINQFQNAAASLQQHGIDIKPSDLMDENIFKVSRQAEFLFKENLKIKQANVAKVDRSKRANAESIAWDYSMLPTKKLKEYGRLKK
jgi:GTP cyclohydrolase II